MTECVPLSSQSRHNEYDRNNMKSCGEKKQVVVIACCNAFWLTYQDSFLWENIS